MSVTFKYTVCKFVDKNKCTGTKHLLCLLLGFMNFYCELMNCDIFGGSQNSKMVLFRLWSLRIKQKFKAYWFNLNWVSVTWKIMIFKYTVCKFVDKNNCTKTFSMTAVGFLNFYCGHGFDFINNISRCKVCPLINLFQVWPKSFFF